MRYSDLPDACPKCQRTFSKHLQRQQWQRKAIGALVGGMAFNILWAVFLYFTKGDAELLRGAAGTGKVGVVLCLYFWPTLAGVFIAVSLPRVVPITCRGCGWARTYCINNRPEPVE